MRATTLISAADVGPSRHRVAMTTTIVGPFLGTEALAAGAVTRRQLARRYQAVYRNVYIPAGQELTAVTRAKAAWLWARRNATAAGLSASALHGSRWIGALESAELMRIGDAAPGILVRRDRLPADEICVRMGIPATTAARTAFELGRRGTLTAAGFPRPETQIVVVDAYVAFVGRIDMGFREWKVGVEYDGPQHWTDPRQHARDIDRLAELAAQGWVVVRVSRDIVRYRRDVAILRTRDAMRAAGWPHWAQIRFGARVAVELGA